MRTRVAHVLYICVRVCVCLFQNEHKHPLIHVDTNTQFPFPKLCMRSRQPRLNHTRASARDLSLTSSLASTGKRARAHLREHSKLQSSLTGLQVQCADKVGRLSQSKQAHLY